MNKLLLSPLLFLCFSLASHAQNGQKTLSISGGQNFSNFIFKDASGAKSDDQSYQRGSLIQLGLGFNLSNGHTFRTELNYQELGSKATYGSVPVSWKLNYLGLGLNYMIPISSKTNFTLSIGPGLGLNYLMNASQTIGQNRYDLNENTSFNKNLFQASAIVNGAYIISKTVSLFGEFRFNYGLNQIENEANTEYKNQKTNLMGFSLAAGVQIKLFSYKL